MRQSFSRSVSVRLVAACVLVLVSTSSFALQQRVGYIINVAFDPAARTIGGTERIQYINNSRDSLFELYVHLYWNAFQPGSLMEQQMRRNGESALASRIATLPPADQGHVNIDSVIIDGKPAVFSIFGTVMRVTFPAPLTEGVSADVIIGFKSHVPALVRRAGFESGDSVEFSMAQWYPKICVYDEKGWHADQYLGKEFYGEFGRFNVNITAPREYCLAASGLCTDVASAGNGYGIRSDTILWNPGDTSGPNRSPADTLRTRSWKFEANNVHDFAWAADREFVHQILVAKALTVHVFFKRRYATAWKDVAKETAKILAYLSEHYGEYAYGQVSVVQAGDGGMEYPQIIFLRGAPAIGTLVHELAHQWFYGMLGSNETSEAWLDEGFTTYATTRAMRDLYTVQHPPRTWLGNVLLPDNNPQQEQFRPYMRVAMSGHEEPVLQHSDAFAESDSYREVYYKTNALLNMLEYTVGDSTLVHILKAYFTKFQLTHPTTEDFIKVCQHVSGMELQWFFDEWLRTTKTCDYALSSVSSTRGSDAAYSTSLSLRRCGQAMMPLDVELTYQDGTRQTVIVPIGWKAKEEPNSIVLPQWGWPAQNYDATFATTKAVASATIDPSLRLQDINRLNNSSGLFPPMRAGLFTRYDSDPPYDAYTLSFVPRLWYSLPQGTKVGLSVDGGYSFDRYVFHAGAYLNTLHMTADWWLNYKWRLSNDVSIEIDGAQEYGIRSATVRAEQRFRPLIASTTEHTLSLQWQYTNLPSSNFPVYTLDWATGELNTAKGEYRFVARGTSTIEFMASFESSLTKLGGFTHADLGAHWTFPLAFFTGSLRGTLASTGGSVPVQKRLYLAAASPSEQYFNTVYRGLAMISPSTDSSAHLFLPGGGGLSGYEDRYSALAGNSLATFNAECALPIFRGDHVLSIAAFGGGGYISNSSFFTAMRTTMPMFDAGVSVNYEFAGSDANLLKSLFLTSVPLSIRVTFPLYVSQPIPGESTVAMRWRLGISSNL